ncbi:MAG: TetR/AcrR family transcriptional regulator [Oscillospiraceae bacterium]
MSNTKGNKRVQYTKAVLRRSLLALLKEKPVDRVTVKDICADAHLNRGTFYAHYGSPEQLLNEIENEFYVDMLSAIATFQQADDVTRILTKVLTALRERKELASVLFGPHGDHAFLSKIVYAAHDMCIYQWGTVSPNADKRVLEAAYSYISHGVLRLVQEWLMAGAEEPPERLAEIMNDLCNYGVSSVIDIPPMDKRGK